MGLNTETAMIDYRHGIHDKGKVNSYFVTHEDVQFTLFFFQLVIHYIHLSLKTLKKSNYRVLVNGNTAAFTQRFKVLSPN